MTIDIKFEIDQEVYFIEFSQGLKKHLAVKYRIKSILIQKTNEGKISVRYYLDLISGLYREIDLFESKQDALDYINERGLNG